MTVALNEMNLYKSTVIADDDSSGGRRSATRVVNAQVGNAVDKVTTAELAAGYDKTTKLFYHIDNDADETLADAEIILDTVTAGDDWAVIYKGTGRDTVADNPAPRLYGVAMLSSDASGATVVVTVEGPSITGIFADGDVVYMIGKARADSASGNMERRTISGAPVVSGNDITITLDSALANSYTVAGGARLSSAIEYGDLACSVGTITTPGGWTYDDTGFPVALDNLGTIEQTWTFEMLTDTTFTCTGDTVGTLSLQGATDSSYAPINPATSKPYFTLAAGGHGGSPAALDTMVFTTSDAEAPFFLRLVGPAGGTAEPANRISPVLLGDV